MDLMAKGWECPKCGAVMSPTTKCCVNCKGGYEITIDSNFSLAIAEQNKRRTFLGKVK